jgi:tetratricopeptide (TPR) repeat protein
MMGGTASASSLLPFVVSPYFGIFFFLHFQPAARSATMQAIRFISIALWAGVLLITGCQAPPVKPPLPPSESDLDLLKSTKLCDTKATFKQAHPDATIESRPWGSGEELRILADRSATKSDESYFFDEDGTLVGLLFVYRSGLDLGPYKTLRYTLSQLKPTMEFYLTVAQLAERQNMEASTLYETGDEKTTTRYLVLGDRSRLRLLEASFTIDPYVKLFSPYRKEFLDRLRNVEGQKDGQRLDSQGAEDKEPFASLQQFARGQAAQLAYCGAKNDKVALDAYQKTAATGFTNKVWQAELHHRLGVSWEAAGDLEKARTELLQSLSLRPNTPEVLNNLGTVYTKLGDKKNALASFEKAVTLRPNYARARFNLAEAIERDNPRRAITEYETYLAIVEGNPDEEDRSALAQKRVKELKQR